MVAATQALIECDLAGTELRLFRFFTSHAKHKGMPPLDTAPTPERSAHMRRIKGKNTKPERLLARELRRLNLWPKRNDKLRPGKPDFAFCRAKLAVFVDGGFWHGKCGLPKTNTEWWAEKFRRNVERDARQNFELARMGWTVLRFDERDVCRKGRAAAIAAQIKEQLGR